MRTTEQEHELNKEMPTQFIQSLEDLCYGPVTLSHKLSFKVIFTKGTS